MACDAALISSMSTFSLSPAHGPQKRHFQVYFNRSLTGQYLVPMQQQKLDHFCPQAMPTLQQEAIADAPDQTPTPEEIWYPISLTNMLSHEPIS